MNQYAKFPTLVDQQLSLGGTPARSVRRVACVGSSGTDLVAAVGQRCPQLTSLLVLEPDAAIAKRLERLFERDPASPTRRVVAGPRALGAAPDFLCTYLCLCQFLIDQRASPRDLGVVVDPALGSTPVGQVLASAARDLTRSYSRRFLDLARAHGELARTQRGLADLFRVGGDPYHALKLYWSLPTESRNPAAAEAMLSCLRELGSAELVERWLAEWPRAKPDPSELRSRLDGDHQRVRAEQAARRKRQLDRNLSWLAARFPEAKTLLATVAPRPDLVALHLPDVPWLLRDGEGALRADYPLVVRLDDAGLTEINPLPDLAELDAGLAQAIPHGQDHACVVGWVRHAALAHHLAHEPTRIGLPGWRRVTFLVEEDLGALRSLLEVADLNTLPDPDSLRILVGPDASQRLADELSRKLSLPVPALSVGLPPALQREVVSKRTQLLERDREAYAALARRYEGFPARLFPVLERGGRPLRLVLLTSRYTTVLQYVAADLAAGFEALGHRCQVLLEETPGECLPPSILARRLLEHEPDVVVMLDHVRPEYGKVFPETLPVVSWLLDELPHLKDPALIAKLGPLDLAYGFSTLVRDLFSQLGYPHVGHLPFAVNPARFVAEPPDPKAHGIAYPTHVAPLPELGALNARLLDRYDALPEIPIERGLIEPELEHCLAALSLAPDARQRRELLHHALMLARRHDRVRIAEQVLDEGLPLDVYGNGWSQIPRFAGCARGVVRPGDPLRRVYREHRAVLHINRGCNVHPRVLEATCSGGLVIGRRDPTDDVPGETADQLEIGTELCLFRTPSEMIALLRRALEDDRFRAETIERGQARVLSDHTYECRARTILEDLKQIVRREVDAEPGATAVAAAKALRESAHA